MPKIPLLPVALVLIFLPACSQLDTERKKASYVIGQQVAANIKQSGIGVDEDALLAGIGDGLKGKSELKPEEAQRASSALQKETQQKIAAEAEKNRGEAREFLEQNRKKPGIQTTGSGLQYEVVKESQGRKPGEASEVVMRYTGTLLSGTVFDSNREKGEQPPLKMSSIMPGLREGIALMPEGARYRFFIPPELAYGAQERPGIPAGSVLVFDVELVKVK